MTGYEPYLPEERQSNGAYRRNEWARFRADFQRLLPGVPVIDLHEPYLSLASGHLVIDILLLGKRLRGMYPDEWENASMEEIIINHYGREAAALIGGVL